MSMRGILARPGASSAGPFGGSDRAGMNRVPPTARGGRLAARECLERTRWSCTAGANDGLVGCGDTGLFGNGTTYGVHGFGTTAGVLGVGTTGVSGVGGSLNGVEGVTASSTASGVYGENDSTGFGVAGRANDG